MRSAWNCRRSRQAGVNRILCLALIGWGGVGILNAQTNHHSCNASLLALCLFAARGACPASPPAYSVVSYMTSQDQAPIGIAEGPPGVFFVQASSSVILSVTTQGTTTILASFPSQYVVESAPGATASNGLLYSSVAQTSSSGGSANVFSVAPTAGSQQT